MGVRGFKTFIEDNDDLLIRNYQLHDSCVIIDAYNLIGRLMKQTRKYKRRELSNEDLALFTSQVRLFFDNFKQCNIKSILVFDGDEQTVEKIRHRGKEKDKEPVLDSENKPIPIKTRYGIFLPPVAATNSFKSIIDELNLDIVQCKEQADIEIAKLSLAYECPVISDDSDFYFFDLPNGLIPIDLIRYQRVNKCSSKCIPKLDDPDISGLEREDLECHNYISCSIFYQDNFVQYFPNLSKTTLPLLGVLAGNDFIQSRVMKKICLQLPLAKICDHYGMSTKQFRRVHTKQQEKILKLLYYMCDKSSEEAINKFCNHVPKEERRKLKDLIKSNMKVYTIPSDIESGIELKLEALSL